MVPHHSAAQAPASTAPTQLPPVEVRGQRLGVEQVVRETSTFATVVDTSEATSKVSSVADVLSESVGVQVRRFGGLGAFSTVSIRGSNPNQVEVYLDNVLQNSANAGLVDLGSLPLDNVERIEIYRSFAPMQLGAGSIGGAINLVTRPVAGETTNLVSASYGSFDTRKVTLYRSQGFDQLGYLVLFNYMGSAGDFTFLDDNGTRFNTLDDQVTTRRNNDFNAFNINAKGEAIVRGWQITLSNDAFIKDQGVPGQSSIQSELARLDAWRNVATLRLEKKTFPWQITDTAFQLAYARSSEHFTDPDGRIGVGVQDTKNKAETLTGNGLLNIYWERWRQTLSLFLEGRYETFRIIDLLPEQRGQPANEGPLEQRTSFLAALQDEMRAFADRLSLRPLLRYQLVHNDFGGQPAFGSVVLNTATVTQEDFVNPSLGVKYKLLSWLDLKGNVGRFGRAPTFFELFGDRGVTLGNPNLVSERGTNWDVGFSLEERGLGIIPGFFEFAYFQSNTETHRLCAEFPEHGTRREYRGCQH